MSQRKIPAPTVTPEAAEFWKAAGEGRFLLRRCTACHETHWYPRAICPFCLGDTAWEEASGSGEIYSWTVMRRVPEPYAMGYVTLDAGPTMLADFAGIPFDDLKIGMKVKLVWSPSEGGPPVPSFTVA
jgi:uncharacterized OB-fold protein